MTVPVPWEESAEELFDHAPCGYLTTLPDGTLTKVNGTFLEWTGYRRDEVVGKLRFPELLTAGGAAHYETYVVPRLIMEGSLKEVALPLECADGTELRVLVSSTIKSAPDGTSVMVRTTVSEASPHPEGEPKPALHDSLTGAATQVFFDDQLKRAVARCGRTGVALAVMMIDLDGFSLVNDELGRHGGDAVLVEAARRLSEAVRSYDLVARMGGDEFAVLCEGTDVDEAERIARRVQEALRPPIAVGDRTVSAPGSVGVVTYSPRKGEGSPVPAPARLVREASAAMDRARRSGSGRHAVCRFRVPNRP